MNKTIDFSKTPSGHNFTATIKPDETTGERFVRLFKDLTLFLLCVSFVVLICWLSYETLVSTASTADEKKWAMSFLSGAAGGLIGYLIRK